MPMMDVESPSLSEAGAGSGRRGPSRQWAGWLLLAYLLAVSTLVFSVRLTTPGLPQLADSLGVWSTEVGPLPGWSSGQAEALMNVAVFVPIGFLLAGLWGRRAGILVATALSAGVELTQLFLLTEPSGTLRDLACNAAGALAGVALHRLIRLARRRVRGPLVQAAARPSRNRWVRKDPSPAAERASEPVRSASPFGRSRALP